MAPPQMSPFVRLPAELRNQIYSYAFEDAELEIDRQYRDHATPAPGMVFACRQTYEETMVMYYSSLNVVSKDPWVLKMWLAYLNYLPESHQFRLIRRAYLDCRNRSEQAFPLQQEQRFALSHHTQLSLDRIRREFPKLTYGREPLFEIMACIATPSQHLIWTHAPFSLGQALEDRWSALNAEQKREMWLEEWSPSGLQGLSWSRR